MQKPYNIQRQYSSKISNVAVNVSFLICTNKVEKSNCPKTYEVGITSFPYILMAKKGKILRTANLR